MADKKKRYWLRGGIIGLVIDIIIITISFTIKSYSSNIYLYYLSYLNILIISIMRHLYWYIMFNLNLIYLFCPKIGPDFQCDYYIEVIFFNILPTLIVYFIIGALIGLIYGKIKHGKN